MDKQLLHGHNGIVLCVALRSNGHVASGSDDGSIIIHSTSSNKVEYQADNVFAEGVEGLCYLLNGSLVACGHDGYGGGTHFKILSPSLELVQTLVGHTNGVYCVTVSPSGSHLASGGRDKKVMDLVGAGGGWRVGESASARGSHLWNSCSVLLPRRQAAGYCKWRQAHQPLQLQRGKCHLSVHVGGPHLQHQVPLVLSRLQTPLLRKCR